MKLFVAFVMSIAISMPAMAQEPGQPGSPSAALPEAQVVTVLQDAALLQSQVNELKGEVDALYAAQDGPSAMSLDDFWSELGNLVSRSDSLLDEIQALVSNVNVDVSRVSNQLISLIGSIQNDINMISATLSANVGQISEEVAGLVPQFNQRVGDLSDTLISIMDRLASQIEAAIQTFTDDGVKQIVLLNDSVRTVLLKLADGTETIVTTVDELGEEFKDLFRSLKAAAVDQIDMVGDNVVRLVQGVSEGLVTTSRVISTTIDNVGNAIIALIEDVRVLIQGLTGDVEKVGAAVRTLYGDTVDYLNEIQFDVTPRIYFTGNSGFDAGVNVVARNVWNDDPRHLLELDVEGLDRSANMQLSLLYGYRPADYFYFKGGIVKNRAGLGVFTGNLYAEGNTSDWVWEAGTQAYGMGQDLRLDAKLQFGQREGIRAFIEGLNLNDDASRDYRVGVGAAWSF